MRFIDAHNHLQDSRFDAMRPSLMEQCNKSGVLYSAVNGASPDDWPLVANLAKNYSWVIPNFGVHPWYINNLAPDWQEQLVNLLDSIPSGVGETGIDGWRKEFDSNLQEQIFITQLEIAAERNIPISIHGLRRWGRLLEILQSSKLTSCGFMLHSYGGPAQMIPAFARLGGYFSFPGFFLKPGREMKLDTFRHVPHDRLLIETDAPDQNLPEELDHFKVISSDTGARINHPANIQAIYLGLANFLGLDVESLSAQVENNFCGLFKSVIGANR